MNKDNPFDQEDEWNNEDESFLDDTDAVDELDNSFGSDLEDEFGQDGLSAEIDEELENPDFDEERSSQSAYEETHERVSTHHITEDDSAETYTRPFFKTPAGMISIVAGVVAVGIVGNNIMGMVSGGDQAPSQAPFADVEPIAPVSTLPVAAPQGAPAPAAPVSPAPSPVEPPVTSSFEAATETEVASVTGNQFTDDQGALFQIDALSEVETLRLKVEENQKTIKELTESLDEALVSLTSMKAALEKERKEVRALLQATDAKVNKLTLSLEEQVVLALDSISKKEEAEKLEAEKQAAAEKEVAKAKSLIRLPDLIIIDSSESGKMIVVKKPSNGRVFVLFEGEQILTPYGRQKITKVDAEAGVITVGSKYFIDDKTPPLPVKKAVEPKKEVKKEPAKPAEPVVSSEYTLSAVFDNGSRFGIINKKGEFTVYSKGDRVPGAGVIESLNDKGQLKVGGVLINPTF